MNDKSAEYEEKLKEMCLTMVSIFDGLREKGKISEEEYYKHTEIKKKFLNNNKSISK